MSPPEPAVAALAERLGLTAVAHATPAHARVFRVLHGATPARLKLFEDERNFTAEVESLGILGRHGAPVPRLLVVAPGEDGAPAAVVTDWWDGRTLLDAGVPPSSREILRGAGETIARVHLAAGEDELAAATFWKRHGYAAWEEVSWRPFIQRRLGKWLDLVRLTEDERRAGAAGWLAAVEARAEEVPEPSRWSVLHCDFSYRNLMADGAGRILGVIDFENASVGDPVYDLAKLPWADLAPDDDDLRDVFLGGWEAVTGTPVDRRLLDTYIAVQAIAALAWVGKRGPEAPAHQDFRDRAMAALAAAGRRLAP